MGIKRDVSQSRWVTCRGGRRAAGARPRAVPAVAVAAVVAVVAGRGMTPDDSSRGEQTC